ncbi:serine hydrolase domain-containing protein [Blastococcus sp. SYSU D00820]
MGRAPDRGLIAAAVEPHVESGAVPGLVWAVARGDDVAVGCAGLLDPATGTPVRRDSLFRISSMTKPVTAVAALVLAEEGRLGLDDPVDELLPELAGRRVLAAPDGPLDDTVPAERPLTPRDLLTSTMGLGADMTGAPQPAMARLAELGLPMGPPAPAAMPPPGEYLRLLGQVPLEHQPGRRWLYHLSLDVLGVLVGRAGGGPFDEVLDARVLRPLGMRDTGFWVPAADRPRFGPSCWTDNGTGQRQVYDPADGQWAARPAFPGGGAGLVSTVDDLLAFGRMLRRGGDGLLSQAAVAAMTTDQLPPSAAVDPTGATGWGFGLGVQRRDDPPLRAGAYGWDGGMGTVWRNDPGLDMTAVLLTNELWSSPEPPPVVGDFLRAAYASVGG